MFTFKEGIIRPNKEEQVRLFIQARQLSDCSSATVSELIKTFFCEFEPVEVEQLSCSLFESFKAKLIKEEKSTLEASELKEDKNAEATKLLETVVFAVRKKVFRRLKLYFLESLYCVKENEPVYKEQQPNRLYEVKR